VSNLDEGIKEREREGGEGITLKSSLKKHKITIL
jgi:hypothetical protein